MTTPYLVAPPSRANFDSEADYRRAIDLVLERADRALYVFDRDLTRMQFDTAERSGLLTEFAARSGPRRLCIVLHDPVPLTLRMPRVLAVIRRFAHVIEVRQAPDECRHLADCHVLADGAHAVRRFHADWARGEWTLDDAAATGPWWARFEELWGLSAPVSLLTTTGLA